MSAVAPDPAFSALTVFLRRVPGVDVISFGRFSSGNWWIKLDVDIDHALAWRVVQELAHVLNYLSIAERLPTTFKPVSPPPYLNGGPKNFLHWVIECHDVTFSPAAAAASLAGRLPQPVDDVDAWSFDDDDGDAEA